MDELAATDAQIPRLGSEAPPARVTHPSSSMRQRLRVRLARWRLDRELADGLPLETSELHGLRGRQLADRRLRAEVAASLRRVVDDAEQPYVVLRSAPLGRPPGLLRLLSDEVLTWREGLLGLAERLEAPTPVGPCGVARARILLSDATGPLYRHEPRRTLGETIWLIADGLRPRPPHRWACPVISKLDPERVTWTCERCGVIETTDDLAARPA